MRREIILCEICKQEHDAQYKLPNEWITTTQNTSYGGEEEKHFCSTICLVKWSGIEPAHNNAPQTKMRRFLLVSEEKDIEGVRWGNGCVSIDPEQQHTSDMWFYRDWDELKEHHDGSGVQWIDQEVKVVDKPYPGYHPPRKTGDHAISITGLRGDKPLEINVD